MDKIVQAVERVVNHVEKTIDTAYDLVFENTKSSIDNDQTAPPTPPTMEDVGEEAIDFDYDEGINPLGGITDNVLADIMKSQAGPESFTDHVDAFRSAIRWKEPFIVSLICFQLFIVLCAIIATRSGSFAGRCTLLILMGSLVYSAEYWNTYGANNWERFASQDYFDRQGVFVGIMLCAPLMLTCFCMLVSYMREASKLVIQVKRKEMAIKNKHKKENENKKSKAGKKKSKKED